MARKPLPMRELLAQLMLQLIEESENPAAEMQLVSSLLVESDLSSHVPRAGETPREFVREVIADNQDLEPSLAMLRVSLNPLDLSEIETPEQLVNRMLPASSE